MRKIVSILALAALLVSCGKATAPKPYGYYRITVPDTAYTDFDLYYPAYPYTFALSRNAVVKPRTDVSEPYWINLFYPDLKPRSGRLYAKSGYYTAPHKEK